MAAYPLTGLSPPLLFGTIRAIFRPIGFRQIVTSAENTFLSVCPLEQGGTQASVQREDGGAEPATDKRVCDALNTNTFLTIVQEQTVPAIVIAAVMYQPPGRPVLLIVHVRNHALSSMMGSLI